MAPTLRVIDKDSFVVGYLEARIGLPTFMGPIVRVSEKSIWTEHETNPQRCWRSGVDHMPSIPVHRLRKADKEAAGVPTKPRPGKASVPAG